MDDIYEAALQLGKKAKKAAVSAGRSWYLPALDSFLPASDVQTEVPLGIMEIPLDRISGTKTMGRAEAFAWNYMPLLAHNTEFAAKWRGVYEYQQEVGVSDPIQVYEYMDKYYVLEGNKRVSVLKYLGATGIDADVTRIVPHYSHDPNIRIYYEYMEFFRITRINTVYFSKPGQFERLLQAVSGDTHTEWSDEQRADFITCFARIEKAFQDLGGLSLPVTPADVLLLYLSVYPYSDLRNLPASELNARMKLIWKEVPTLYQSTEQALVLDPDPAGGNILNRYLARLGAHTLKVAFVHDKQMQGSGWVYSHELGRMHLQQVFGSQVETRSYFGQDGTQGRLELIEQAIDDGARIVFTTGQRMIEDSLKAAIEHPHVRILNCCLDRPYHAIRTYYGRLYEAKFLSGLIAGAMAEDDRIAYIADYPVYGSIANINAFALGAAMTNPRAKVHLFWESMKDISLWDEIRSQDLHIISDTDMMRPGTDSHFGLYELKDGRYRSLAAPVWNWGVFYEKIIRDILNGSYNTAQTKSRDIIHYWWGISGGIIDLIMDRHLDIQVQRLAGALRSDIAAGHFHIFEGEIRREDGTLILEEGQYLTWEQIIHMDWLNPNIVGRIPEPEELDERGQEMLRVQGIPRENAPLPGGE